MTQHTPAEAIVANVARMGNDLGAVYSALWQEVAWIHNKWERYVALYGTNPERINLLNKAAPATFGAVQDALWEDVLLHLARLSDPPKSVGRANLSLPRLVELVATPPVKKAAENALAEVQAKCAFAKDWRNRRIAHRDLDLALNQSALSIADASRQSVNEALAAVAALLNVVSRHYLDSESLFSLRPGDDSEVEFLLDVLSAGLAAQLDEITHRTVP